MPDMTGKEKKACTQDRYEVSPQELPLSCPLPNERIWDAHPRIYLPIEKNGHAVCPYCDREFILKSR